MAQFGRAPDLGSGGRRFKSCQSELSYVATREKGGISPVSCKSRKRYDKGSKGKKT